MPIDDDMIQYMLDLIAEPPTTPQPRQGLRWDVNPYRHNSLRELFEVKTLNESEEHEMITYTIGEHIRVKAEGVTTCNSGVFSPVDVYKVVKFNPHKSEVEAQLKGLPRVYRFLISEIESTKDALTVIDPAEYQKDDIIRVTRNGGARYGGRLTKGALYQVTHLPDIDGGLVAGVPLGEVSSGFNTFSFFLSEIEHGENETERTARRRKAAFHRWTRLRHHITTLIDAVEDSYAEPSEVSQAFYNVQAYHANHCGSGRGEIYDKLVAKFPQLSHFYCSGNYNVTRWCSIYYPSDYIVEVQDTGEVVPIHHAEENYYYADYEGEWWTSEDSYDEYLREDSRDAGVYDWNYDVTHKLDFMRAEGEGQVIADKIEYSQVWKDDRRYNNGGYYKRIPVKVKKDATIYMGVELEVHVRNPECNMSEYVYDDLGSDFVVCKRDSSVAESDAEGFEIVTAPATLKVQQTRWDKFLGNNARFFKGWYADDCGIHVHLSRDAFKSNAHLSKFVCFINQRSNAEFVSDVAGRNSNQWASFRATKRACPSTYKAQQGERYQAVNLQNAKTVEVRIFRSNVAKAGFNKNLEFCHALFHYTMQTGWSEDKQKHGNSLHYKDFIEWCDKPEQRSQYKYLNVWLQRQGYIKQRITGKRASIQVAEVTLADAA